MSENIELDELGDLLQPSVAAETFTRLHMPGKPPIVEVGRLRDGKVVSIYRLDPGIPYPPHAHMGREPDGGNTEIHFIVKGSGRQFLGRAEFRGALPCRVTHWRESTVVAGSAVILPSGTAHVLLATTSLVAVALSYPDHIPGHPAAVRPNTFSVDQEDWPAVIRDIAAEK